MKAGSCFWQWCHLWQHCCWSRWGRNFQQWLVGCVQFCGMKHTFMLTQKMMRKENKSQVHPECTLEAMLGRLFQMWLETVTKNFLPYSSYQRKHLFYYKDIQISWKKKTFLFLINIKYREYQVFSYRVNQTISDHTYKMLVKALTIPRGVPTFWWNLSLWSWNQKRNSL